MQVFKTFFKILKQHNSSVIIYSVIFVVLLLLLTANGQSENAVFKESSVDIAIADLDRSEFSESFIAYMKTKQNVTLIEKDDARMAEELYYGTYHVILEIPKQAGADLKAGKDIILKQYDNPDSSAQAYVSRQADAFLTAYKAYAEAGYEGAALEEKVLENLALETNVSITGSGESEDSSLHMYYRYLAFIIISILITAMAPILIAFRKKEVQARSLCSAMPKIKQNLGVFAAASVCSIGLLGIFILISAVLYGKSFGANVWVYFLNSFVFMLVSAGVLFLITTYDLSQNMVTIIANVVGMGMAFLGGIFVSLDILSESVLNISRWLPTYWYVQVLDKVVSANRDLKFTDVAKPIGIQLLMAVTFFAVALVLRQIQKDKA